MSDAGQALGADDVVGREAEQAHIGAFVALVPEGTRALVVRGEPGIGKTTLWRQAVERCREAGLTVLTTRPAEEELSLILAGLVDLFDFGSGQLPAGPQGPAGPAGPAARATRGRPTTRSPRRARPRRRGAPSAATPPGCRRP